MEREPVRQSGQGAQRTSYYARLKELYQTSSKSIARSMTDPIVVSKDISSEWPTALGIVKA